MCYFQSINFKLYPEFTRIHEDYYQNGETEQEHHTRILAQHRAQNAANRERNALGQVPTCELAERKAAERKAGYQPKDIATIEWSPANNPTKILKAGADRPETLGTFRGENGIEEAEAAIRRISPDLEFVLPNRFAENVACLNPKDDRMYFDRHGN